MGKRGRRLPRVVERDQAVALLAAPNVRCPTGLRNRAMLETMYRAGLRVGEVVNLRPGDIRWGAMVLDVRRGKGNVDRSVPFGSELAGWLRAWAERRPKGKGRRFFTTLAGGAVSSRYVQQMVKRMASRAGLEGLEVTPHVMRHTYATELLDDGFTIREVQTLLGHANVRTTQLYTHVNGVELAAKVRARDEAAEPDVDVLARQLAGLPAATRQALVEALGGGR